MSKFKTFLIRNLDLREKEVDIFIFLFLHSFFVGWFIAFYFVSANSVFIVNYGSEHLPYAYMLAGVAGYLVSTIYSWFQKIVNSKTLFLIALSFMFFISLAAPIGLKFFPEKYLSIFVFIWAWPFISLSAIELGGLAIRFLNLAQVKRLYGLFNMGGVLAAIISYFTVPFLKHAVSHIYQLLYIGAGALILAIIVLFWLYKIAGIKEDVKIEVVKTAKRTKINFWNLLKEKYFVWIFLSATLSMTMIYLTDFGFLSSVKVSIKPDHVAQYLSIVFGALKVGELIISYYSRRLLSQYGVRLGLTALPVTSSTLVAIAAIIGLTFGAETILFLGVMTLLKSLERIIRRGLDDPAFNILYQPLPEEQKLAVQVRVGVVMQLAIGIAGVLLWLANRILVTKHGFQLQFYPLFFLPILLLWVYVAINLYKSYKQKIREILAKISKDKRRDTDKYQYGSEILKKRLKSEYPHVVEFSATILSETNPKIIEPYASIILKKTDNQKLYKVVLKYVEPTWRKRLSKIIQTLLQQPLADDVRIIAQKALYNLDFSDIEEELSFEQAEQLLNSQSYQDRIKLIKYIHKRLYKPTDEQLLKLLNDKNKLVKIAAINVAHVNKTDIILRQLSDFLKIKEYRHIAANAMIELGGIILPFIEEYFENEAETEILLKSIEILAKIGTKEAKKILIKYINYPDREVQLGVIWGLYFCKFQADEQTRPIIRKKLEETIENIVWIYSAIEDIYDKKGTMRLFQALEYEKELNLDTLFLLLSFLYEPRIITLIQKNIAGKEIIFALEIIDNFFDSDIKKLIAPLFEDIAPAQKIKRFSKIFPQKRMDLEQRLKDIILRDYNKIDPWTVAKAIEVLGRTIKRQTKHKSIIVHDFSDVKIWTRDNIQHILEYIRKSEIPDEIFAALYHSEEIVYSTAAKIIFDENPIKCFDYLSNMSPQKQKLMKILAHNGYLIQDKIKLLKRHQLFLNVYESHLIKLAKQIEVIELNTGQELDYNQYNSDIVIILNSGVLAFQDKHYFAGSMIIKGLNLDEFANVLEVKKNATLLVIPRIDFFDVLISERNLIASILSLPENLKWILQENGKPQRHKKVLDKVTSDNTEQSQGSSVN